MGTKTGLLPHHLSGCLSVNCFNAAEVESVDASPLIAPPNKFAGTPVDEWVVADPNASRPKWNGFTLSRFEPTRFLSAVRSRSSDQQLNISNREHLSRSSRARNTPQGNRESEGLRVHRSVPRSEQMALHVSQLAPEPSSSSEGTTVMPRNQLSSASPCHRRRSAVILTPRKYFHVISRSYPRDFISLSRTGNAHFPQRHIRVPLPTCTSLPITHLPCTVHLSDFRLRRAATLT